MLYFVATPIGNLQDITLRALETLKDVDMIACEDTRVSKKLLSHYGISKPLMAYHDHNAEQKRPHLIAQLKEGKSLAYITDGGMPLISDPGYKLVKACQEENLSYTVIPGPSAPLMALCLSGLSPAQFYFAGFLSTRKAARITQLEALKSINATLLFFETAKRLLSFLSEAQKILGDRKAAVCREMTKLYEETQWGTLSSLYTHYEHTPPRGEIVVVIEGEQHGEAIAREDVEAHLKEAFSKSSLKESVELVSQALGLSKREVYQHALRLKSKEKSLS